MYVGHGKPSNAREAGVLIVWQLLCSAYALGADSQRLGQLYESEAQQLMPWEESPEELTREDWSEHLGDRRLVLAPEISFAV